MSDHDKILTANEILESFEEFDRKSTAKVMEKILNNAIDEAFENIKSLNKGVSNE